MYKVNVGEYPYMEVPQIIILCIKSDITGQNNPSNLLNLK